MRRICLLLSVATLLAVSGGCARPASADEVKSTLPRDVLAALPGDDLARLVAGNTEFACELYRQVRQGDENLFFSPYSISLALAMTYAGAEGQTAEQMASALHFYLPADSLHSAFNYLDQQLASRGSTASGKEGEGFRLNVVNAIWGEKEHKFLDGYLDTLARNYGAGLRVLDFKSAPEPSRGTINQWVEQQTEGRIKDLIPKDAINPLTRLVLTNAVYFNAAWASQFEKNTTAPGVFQGLNGAELTVPMMQQTAYFGYLKGSGFEAVELPYDGYELSMVILMPDKGQLDAFETEVDAELLQQTFADLQRTRIALTMPKFKLETSFGLNSALKALGMDAAFDPQEADFSGMDGLRDLFITDAIHKAFVDVDESGTEAAAATAIVMNTTSMPAEPIQVVVDRPFLFLIRDGQTGTVLFLGRVVNPA